MKIQTTFTLLAISVFGCALSQPLYAQSVSPAPNQDWPTFGGSPETTHYSSLTQINRANVKQLKVAWTFDTHETGQLQSSPIVVEGVLFGISPTQKIFALDAATGKLLWQVRFRYKRYSARSRSCVLVR